jgi:hypothetical protein
VLENIYKMGAGNVGAVFATPVTIPSVLAKPYTALDYAAALTKFRPLRLALAFSPKPTLFISLEISKIRVFGTNYAVACV